MHIEYEQAMPKDLIEGLAEIGHFVNETKHIAVAQVSLRKSIVSLSVLRCVFFLRRGVVQNNDIQRAPTLDIRNDGMHLRTSLDLLLSFCRACSDRATAA
jgi:hypothetical protein